MKTGNSIQIKRLVWNYSGVMDLAKELTKFKFIIKLTQSQLQYTRGTKLGKNKTTREYRGEGGNQPIQNKIQFNLKDFVTAPDNLILYEIT